MYIYVQKEVKLNGLDQSRGNKKTKPNQTKPGRKRMNPPRKVKVRGKELGGYWLLPTPNGTCE